MSAYADTSFLVSLYILDVNSARAAGKMQNAQLPLLLTPLIEVELANALYLRLFRKELPPAKIKGAQALFRKDIAGGVFDLKPFSADVFHRASLIANRHTPKLGTRTLDVLHVASAVLLQADTFYTFDRNREKLAVAEGFTVG